MSAFVENITKMSEADLKAWCFQQISSDTYVQQRIAEADRLMSWIVSSQATSQCSSDDPQSGTTEERFPSRPQSSEPQNCYSQVPPSSTEHHPADSHSAGRTESVSGHVRHQSGCAMHDGPAGDEKRRDCGGFPSPTDAELRQHGCPALVEPRARTFLCQLPDSDLAAINAGVIPTPLMKLLGRVAYNEIERRRCA